MNHSFSPEKYSRREIVKLFALGTASTVLGGQLCQTTIAWGAELGPSNLPGTLRINVNDFPVLANIEGSIRLAVNPITGGIDSYPLGVFYPVMVTRLSATEFKTLDCFCPHAGCVVESFNSGNIWCPCHGSRFDIHGEVTNGPAERSLTVLKSEYDGVSQLKIEVPGLSFHAEPTLVSGNRMKLDFYAQPNVRYRVLTRATMTAAWTEVPFALTQGGAFNQSEFLGGGEPATVYAELSGNAGYFSLGVMISNYG